MRDARKRALDAVEAVKLSFRIDRLAPDSRAALDAQLLIRPEPYDKVLGARGCAALIESELCAKILREAKRVIAWSDRVGIDEHVWFSRAPSGKPEQLLNVRRCRSEFGSEIIVAPGQIVQFFKLTGASAASSRKNYVEAWDIGTVIAALVLSTPAWSVQHVSVLVRGEVVEINKHDFVTSCYPVLSVHC